MVLRVMPNYSYPHVIDMPRSHIELVKEYRRAFGGSFFLRKIVIEDIGTEMLRIECECEKDRAMLVLLREAKV